MGLQSQTRLSDFHSLTQNKSEDEVFFPETYKILKDFLVELQ